MRNTKNRRGFWLRRGLRFLAFGLLFGALIGWVVMVLWNALLPDVLGVSRVTFWQALGLLVLSRILFGGYGGRGFSGARGFNGGRNNRSNWRQKMAGRWQQLTPEQREQMKQHWRDRCDRRGAGNTGREKGPGAAPETTKTDPTDS